MNDNEKRLHALFSALTPAEIERLSLLSEECGEVIGVVNKILRHGYESVNPLRTGHIVSNRQDLEKEIGHVMNAVHMMTTTRGVARGVPDLDYDAIRKAQEAKRASIARWLHHQPKPAPEKAERALHVTVKAPNAEKQLASLLDTMTAQLAPSGSTVRQEQDRIEITRPDGTVIHVKN